jgi:hypothetical protein
MKCNEQYRSGHDLTSYRCIIKYHRDVNNITQLIENYDFKKQIVETLKAWGMDQQGAMLEQSSLIYDSINKCRDYLDELYSYRLAEIDNKTLSNLKDALFLLFRDLKIMKSKRRIVGVAKTMHFLLPDLVMPVDGKYTMNAIYGYNKISKTTTDEFEDYFYILKKFHEICKHYKLSLLDFDTSRWNTSIPKIIDNAIIGLASNNEYVGDYLETKIKDYGKDNP